MYQKGDQKYTFSSITKIQSALPLTGLVTLGCLSLRSYSAASTLIPGHIKADSLALFPAVVNGDTCQYDEEGYSLEPHRHLRTGRC